MKNKIDSEEFEIKINYKDSIKTVYCSRFWGHKSLHIHCYVNLSRKWDTAVTFYDVTGYPLHWGTEKLSNETLCELISKELEKIRHTFKKHDELSVPLYSNWK